MQWKLKYKMQFTLTKSAVMMANSVWDPGSHTALMMKFPVASWGCSTRWSDTEPVLLNVRTWQSYEKWQMLHNLVKSASWKFSSLMPMCLHVLPWVHTLLDSPHYRDFPWGLAQWREQGLRPVESKSIFFYWSLPALKVLTTAELWSAKAQVTWRGKMFLENWFILFLDVDWLIAAMTSSPSWLT